MVDGRLETTITLDHGDLPGLCTRTTLHLGTPSHLDSGCEPALCTPGSTLGVMEGGGFEATYQDTS